MSELSGKHGNEILISIRPKWTELIKNGQKIDEIRKTKPAGIGSISYYRVYIYETGGGGVIGTFLLWNVHYVQAWIDMDGTKHLGNTIGLRHCIDDSELFDYLYNEDREKSCGWAWRIEDLKIFDKPMKLEQFGLKRPPQDWCYVKK